MDVHEMRAQGLRCKQASYALAQLCTEKKDAALERMAAVLWDGWGSLPSRTPISW